MVGGDVIQSWGDGFDGGRFFKVLVLRWWALPVFRLSRYYCGAFLSNWIVGTCCKFEIVCERGIGTEVPYSVATAVAFGDECMWRAPKVCELFKCFGVVWLNHFSHRHVRQSRLILKGGEKMVRQASQVSR